MEIVKLKYECLQVVNRLSQIRCIMKELGIASYFNSVKDLSKFDWKKHKQKKILTNFNRLCNQQKIKPN